jgi:hypothetical protein
MQITYAVTWDTNGVEPRSGRLELGPGALVLEGANGSGSTCTEIRYDDLLSARVTRARAGRLGGKPTLVLEQRRGPSVRVASVGQAGALSELAERLATLRLGDPDPAPSAYVSYEAMPGPGDSEGGDVYSPER